MEDSAVTSMSWRSGRLEGESERRGDGREGGEKGRLWKILQ